MTARPSSPQVISEPLGGSALSLAVQEGRLPADLQPPAPRTAQEWTDHVARVRERGSGWYASVEGALAPSGVAAARLRRVVAGHGVVVTTGQQAGLFGGPMYTLSKALTALETANQVEERTGVPTAPIFWAATDDADFHEACVAHVADAEGLRELRLTQPPPAGTMMSHTRMAREDIRALVSQLRRSSGSAPNGRFLEMATSAFSGAATLGGAYVAFLRALLEPLGIAVFDASDTSYRKAAAPVLRDALRRAAAIEKALSATTHAARQAGYEVQVDDDRGLSLVFEITNGVKRRRRIEEREHASTELSPNVLLRPVVERELMPTVGYVGGPAEIAYFVQSNAVARCLERQPVVGVPRWSCTILEPFVQRALGRLGVEWREVRDLHALERRLAVQALPDDVAASWKSLRSGLQSAVDAYRRAVERHDLLPGPVIDGLERSLQHRLSRGERRLLAAVKRREEATRRDLTAASAALFPLGKKQERVLNYVPMLARGGDALLDAMRREARKHAASLVAARREPAVASP